MKCKLIAFEGPIRVPVFSTFAAMRFLILGILMSPPSIMAQCFTNEATATAAAADAAYAEGLKTMEQTIENYTPSAARSWEVVDVPVVVHVLYTADSNNISDNQILSQIDALNRDFNAENWDRVAVPDDFADRVGSAGIRFHLADQDPDGSWTKGINRVQVFENDIGSTQHYYKSSRGGIDPWPQAHYLNVWVCDIEDLTLGFAILPSSHMAENDGIVIESRVFGTLGTVEKPYNNGRTFVHEVAHYFGLRHIWGDDDDSCADTDYVPDTPYQRGPNYGCSTHPTLSCLSEPSGDMFMNYMDYGHDSCLLFFTTDQCALMQLVYSTARSALSHSPGYTGINEVQEITAPFWPQPASEWVEFADEAAVKKVALRDMQGQMIGIPSGALVGNRMMVDWLPRGIYLLEHGGRHWPLMVQP